MLNHIIVDQVKPCDHQCISDMLDNYIRLSSDELIDSEDMSVERKDIEVVLSYMHRTYGDEVFKAYDDIYKTLIEVFDKQ